MSTIQDIFQQAQLAEAAYANFWDATLKQPITDETKVKAALIAAGFSKNSSDPTQSAQATDFVAHWRVVDHIPNTDSGFSATVFESLDHPGQYTFAVRGTEPLKLSDLSADAYGIGGQGIALRQALDLYNYRKSLDTAAGQPYQAAYLKMDLTETAILTPLWVAAQLPGGEIAYNQYKAQLESNGYWVEGAKVSTLALGVSTEALAGTELAQGRSTSTVQLGTGYDVVGHSLGGHLSMVLGRLDSLNVASVETFNPPYFDPFTSDKRSGEFFSQLRQLEIANSGTSSIATAFGPSQNYVISGDAVHDIGATRPGTQSLIFSETEDTNAVAAHSVKAMTDALAVYNLFATLDSSLNTDSGLVTITGLLKAASNVGANSLESIITELGKLLSVPGTTFTGNAFDTNGRDLLYQAVQAIQGTLTAGAGITHAAVISLTSQDATTVIAKAEQNDAEGEAYRYALKELNPFVVTGVNYTQHNANGELNLYDPDTGEGALSAQYLADRAAMLSWLNLRNTQDNTDTILTGDTPEQLFHDVNSQTTVRLGSIFNGDSDRHQYRFGSNAGETLAGGSVSDRLYGMGGNDTLTGGLGNDHLEGGLNDDTLIGGEGDDVLDGGLGTDIYRIAGGLLSGDGHDTILDADKKGFIIYQSEFLGLGGFTRQDNLAGLYRMSGNTNQWNYTLGPGLPGSPTVTLGHNSPWKITLSDGSIVELGNIQRGDYGLFTIDDTPAAIATTRDIIGDLAPVDHNPALDGTQTQTDDLGNLITDPNVTEADRADTLHGSSGNDRIEGRGGNDTITAGAGDDLADGGEGQDILQGETGNDQLTGGAGQDILIGSDGTDTLYADTQTTYDQIATQSLATAQRGDLMDGGNDDDELHGDAGDDILMGGAGTDLLLGGAGDDNLWGDYELQTAALDWSITRTVWQGGVNVTYHTQLNNAADTLSTDGRADYLNGGAGDDWIFAGAGNDVAEGSTGNDVIFGEEDHDVLHGGDGNDVLIGDSTNTPVALQGNDWLYGDAGDDRLEGSGGADRLYGGSGNDRLEGDTSDTAGNDYLDGGSGDDTLIGAAGNDELHGGEDNDILSGDADNIALAQQGDDLLYGEAGDDDINGYAGTDTLDGGAGADQLFGGLGQDTLTGGDGNDSLVGDEGNSNLDGGEADMLNGGAGDDVLFGQGGDDTLAGGTGTDQMQGGVGDDTYTFNLGDGTDTLIDSSGINTIRFGAGINVADITASYDNTSGNFKLVYGNNGDDSVTYPGGLSGNVITDYQFADGSQYTHQQLMDMVLPALGYTGTASTDNVIGGGQNDVISGNGGNDSLIGNGGDDRITVANDSKWRMTA